MTSRIYLWTWIVLYCCQLSKTNSDGGKIAPIESESDNSKVGFRIGAGTL